MCFKIITQKVSDEDTCCPSCCCCMCCCAEDEAPKAYNLIYFPGAWAKTDPPASFGELIAQRRRWINGSKFIFFYIICNFGEIFQSNHSVF